MIIRHIALFFMLISMLSCNSSEGSRNTQKAPGKKEMAELNRYMVQKDRERIQNYIERKGLSMKETESGLWYQIISEGNGNYFSDNDRVVMDYDCFLLDGTRCYDSKESGYREVILGRSELESGLNQGLRMLKPGGEALFILPPFLAYGLVGDGRKIPPRSVVVYNIRIITSVD